MQINYQEKLKECREIDAKELSENLEFRERMLPLLYGISDCLNNFPYTLRYNKINTKTYDLIEMLEAICTKLEVRFNAELELYKKS